MVHKSLRAFGGLAGPVMVVGARHRLGGLGRDRWDRRMDAIPEGPDAALRQGEGPEAVTRPADPVQPTTRRVRVPFAAGPRPARWKAPTPLASRRARSGETSRRAPPAGGRTVSGAEGLPSSHRPVLVDLVVELFAPVPPGVVVDATLGGGGHAEALLDAHPHLSVLGLDQDPDAIAAATARLARFGDRVTVRRTRFDEIARVVAEVLPASATPAPAAPVRPRRQLAAARPARAGLQLPGDGPLDMRMDPSAARSARPTW